MYFQIDCRIVDPCGVYFQIDCRSVDCEVYFQINCTYTVFTLFLALIADNFGIFKDTFRR